MDGRGSGGFFDHFFLLDQERAKRCLGGAAGEAAWQPGG
jgi:hypothetical protein